MAVRVLMSSAPMVGHVVPLLSLGQALRDAGHDVRVATHPDRHELIKGVGLVTVPAGMSGPAMTHERIRRWPETTNQPATAFAIRMFTQILAPSTLSDLRTLIEDWEPDLLVHEEGEYAGPVAACWAGIPWVTHAWGSPLRPIEELDAVGEYAAGLWSTVGLAVPQWSGLYGHGLVNPCPASLQPVAPGASNVWPVRPATLGGFAGPTAVQSVADAYVGFGTVPIFADDLGILSSAVRACTARGLRTVVTATDNNLTRALADLHHELVDARTFVALPDVLASAESWFVTAARGRCLRHSKLEIGVVRDIVGDVPLVPMVIVSKGSPSQTRMADACAHAGVAAISDGIADNIESAIARVLDDRSFQQRSAAVREEIGLMPAPADLVEPLQQLAPN